MGEKKTAERRTNRQWSGKLLTVGSTGFLAAVSLMLVMGTAGAGAVHAAVVKAPPYAGTVSFSNAYNSWGQCGTAKYVTEKWSGKTGMIHGSAMGKGFTGAGCKSVGTYGGGGSGYAATGVEVFIPLGKVTTGNHSVSSSWSLTLATTKTFTYGGCPTKNVNYNPPLYSYSYGQCYDSASVSWSAAAWLVDTTNSSWSSYNFSYASAYNSSYFSNYTSCSNYGSPSCYNSTYGSNYSYAYGYNDPGFTAFTWNGVTTFTFWNNGSYMKSTDKYWLGFDMGISGSGYAQSTNLATPWGVVAAGSVNMLPLANGATLSSVTIT